MIEFFDVYESGCLLGISVVHDGNRKILLTPTEARMLELFCTEAPGPYDCVSFCRGRARSIEVSGCLEEWTVLFKDLSGELMKTSDLRGLGRKLFNLRDLRP